MDHEVVFLVQGLPMETSDMQFVKFPGQIHFDLLNTTT